MILGNSPFSCEALVDARCAGDEARIASNRACALPTAYSCLSACGGRGGSLNVDLGTCLCDTVTVPEEIPCYDCNTVSSLKSKLFQIPISLKFDETKKMF